VPFYVAAQNDAEREKERVGSSLFLSSWIIKRPARGRGRKWTDEIMIHDS
jgi:hypothetical protein